MRACAAPRKDGPGTWISEEIIDGYAGLHAMGYAHSSEVWLDGELVGGALVQRLRTVALPSQPLARRVGVGRHTDADRECGDGGDGSEATHASHVGNVRRKQEETGDLASDSVRLAEATPSLFG